MPERECPQERPQCRRRRHTMPEHRPGLPRAQHVTVIDAVRPEAHRDTKLISLRPGFAAPARSPRSTVCSTRPSIPSRSASTAGSRTPAFATTRSSSKSTLVASGRPFTVGDLLVQARRRRIRQLSACSGGHLNRRPGRLPTDQRRIKAKATARSRATQHISLEPQKSRGSPRTSQIPWSFPASAGRLYRPVGRGNVVWLVPDQGAHPICQGRPFAQPAGRRCRTGGRRGGKRR